MFRNMIRVYGEEFLAPRPNPKLEDHPLSAVRDGLFNIFAATLHIGGCSSIRNVRMRHAVETGTHSLRAPTRHRRKTTQDTITLLVLDIVGFVQVLIRQ
jgi:hypothetical protein